MTSSDDLASFLLARTVEDQLVALGAALAEEQFGQTGNITEDTADDPRLLRIRHFSTERLRFEAAIRRQLVEMHRPPAHGCAGADDDSQPCPTLRLLGLPYDRHPDYRPEWRP